MNNDDQRIERALNSRFARAGSPSCPQSAWRADTKQILRSIPAAAPLRRHAYLGISLALMAVATIGAQGSTAVRESYERFMTPFFIAAQTLVPGIHATERLTIAEAQRRMPFTIVDPAGLPARTRFRYAHVLSESPPRVALSYETDVQSTYYRMSIEESAVAPRLPVTRFTVRLAGHTIDWSLPTRTWKHGSVFMTLFAWQSPRGTIERIERANAT